MILPERTMLSFPIGNQRFNHRVAGVIIHEGHVLVCREDDDAYVLLPGGRIELGEASAEALDRELDEELGYNATVGRLLFSAEDFFERAGETFHEVGLYYEASVPAEFPFAPGEVVLVREDEGHELSFSWIATDSAALNAVTLVPVWLRSTLQNLPATPRHIVHREAVSHG